MTSNAKLTIFLLIFFVFAFVISFGFKSNFETGDDKTLRFFKESSYQMALAYAEELEKHSNSIKYPLYQAYILRETGSLERSTSLLKKALKFEEKPPAYLLEIHLNLAMNAYLSHDRATLKEQITEIKLLKNSTKDYLDLFQGLAAFLEEDYEKALTYFQKHKTASSSPWLQHSFEKTFTPIWLDEKIILCLIETCRFDLADKKLMVCSSDDRICFLKAFNAYKQALENKSTDYDFSNLQAIHNKELIANKFKTSLSKVESHLVECARCHTSDYFLLSFSFLNEFMPFIDLNSLASNLSEEVDAFDLFEKIQGPLRDKLVQITRQKIEKMLEKGEIENLLPFAELLKKMDKNRDFIQKIGVFSLKNTKFLEIWTKLENDPQEKRKMAVKLIAHAENLWRDGSHGQAVETFKAAYAITVSEEKEALKVILEASIANFYKKALSEDRIDQYFHILDAVKALKLNGVNIYDDQHKNLLLDDADYFFSKALYEKALERVEFVLSLEPENEKAKSLILKINQQKFN